MADQHDPTPLNRNRDAAWHDADMRAKFGAALETIRWLGGTADNLQAVVDYAEAAQAALADARAESATTAEWHQQALRDGREVQRERDRLILTLDAIAQTARDAAHAYRPEQPDRDHP